MTRTKVVANLVDYRALAARDRANLKRLTEELGAGALVVVPELDGDVHDLDGLAAMAGHLYANR